jgi:hypothetical protein
MDRLPSVSLRDSLSAWPTSTHFAEGEHNCGMRPALNVVQGGMRNKNERKQFKWNEENMFTLIKNGTLYGPPYQTP